MSDYERWTYSIAHDLIERGVITVDDWNDGAALGDGSDASNAPTIENSQQPAPRGAWHPISRREEFETWESPGTTGQASR